MLRGTVVPYATEISYSDGPKTMCQSAKKVGSVGTTRGATPTYMF